MAINIINKKTGKVAAKITDDIERDTVVVDGKEVSYLEEANRKEKEIQDAKKDGNIEDQQQ